MYIYRYRTLRALRLCSDNFVVPLVLCAMVTGCSNRTPVRVWRETGPAVAELSVFDRTMQDFMVSQKVSAGALAITHNSRLVFARGYTWAGADSAATQPSSLLRIASLSKPVTSAAALRLVEDGKLRLDEKVVGILPFGCPEGQHPDPNLKEVTVLRLLQHLGGWDRNESFDPMFHDKTISRVLDVPLPISHAEIITFMNGQPLQHKPGTEYAYSNYGYCLLGRVIEQRSEIAYDDYVKKNVLSPLGIIGMKLGCSKLEDQMPGEMTYESKRGGAYGTFNLENMDSHGGWLAAAPELARFAAAFDKPGECPILSAESIETMFSLPETIAADDYRGGRAILRLRMERQRFRRRPAQHMAYRQPPRNVHLHGPLVQRRQLCRPVQQKGGRFLRDRLVAVESGQVRDGMARA